MGCGRSAWYVVVLFLIAAVRSESELPPKIQSLLSLFQSVQTYVDAEPIGVQSLDEAVDEFVGKFQTGRKLQQVVKTSKEVKDTQLSGLQFGFLPYKLEGRFLGLGSDQEGFMAQVGYAQAVALFAFPGAVMGILSIISCWVFIFARCCCNLFGGRSRSIGCFCGGVKGECCACCGSDPGDWKGYTRREMIAFYIMFIINAACILFLPIIGFVGNAGFHDGVGGVFGTVTDTMDDIVLRAGNIKTSLARQPYTNSSDMLEPLETAIDSVGKFKETVVTYRNFALDYDNYRSYAIIGVMCVPMLIAVFGLLALAFRAHRVSMCVGIFCFLGSALLWWMFAVHNPIGLVFYDACEEADRFLKGNSGTDKVTYPSVLECKDGTIAPLQPLLEQADDGINLAFDAICDAGKAACNISSTMYCSATCNRTNAETYKNEILSDLVPGCVYVVGQPCRPYVNASCLPANAIPCPLRNITFDQCRTQCNMSELRTFSTEIVSALATADAYADIIDDQVRPLISCEYINNVISGIKDNICIKMGGGIDSIATACVVVSCFFIPFTFLAIMGCKRLNRDNPDPSKVSYDDDYEQGMITLKIADDEKTHSGLPADYGTPQKLSYDASGTQHQYQHQQQQQSSHYDGYASQSYGTASLGYDNTKPPQYESMPEPSGGPSDKPSDDVELSSLGGGGNGEPAQSAAAAPPAAPESGSGSAGSGVGSEAAPQFGQSGSLSGRVLPPIGSTSNGSVSAAALTPPLAEKQNDDTARSEPTSDAPPDRSASTASLHPSTSEPGNGALASSTEGLIAPSTESGSSEAATGHDQTATL